MNTSPDSRLATTAADYSWRPAMLADLPGIHAMLLEVDAADGSTAAGTLADMQREFVDPWSNPATATRIALSPDGGVAAFTRIYTNPEPVGEAAAFLLNEVHPRHRGIGLESAQFDWAEARGGQRLREVAAAHPGLRRLVLRVGANDTLRDRMTANARRGFQPARSFYRMRRQLSDPIPALPSPDGLSIVPYRADLDEAVRLAFNETFSELWGHEPESREDWLMFHAGHTAFRPDLTLVALDGDQVAGYAIIQVRQEDNARSGVSQGYIDKLGVRRPWRRRGLASALIVQAMRAFRAEGHQFAALGVDTENATGALAIYERLGFRVYKRYVAFEKEVS